MESKMDITLLDYHGYVKVTKQPEDFKELEVPLATCPVGLPLHVLADEKKIIADEFLNVKQLDVHGHHHSQRTEKRDNDPMAILNQDISELNITMMATREFSAGIITGSSEQTQVNSGPESNNSTSQRRKHVHTVTCGIGESCSDEPFFTTTAEEDDHDLELLSAKMGPKDACLDLSSIELATTPGSFGYGISSDELMALEKRDKKEEAPTEEAPTEEAPTEESSTGESPTEESQTEESPKENSQNIQFDINKLLSNKTQADSKEVTPKKLEKKKAEEEIQVANEITPRIKVTRIANNLGVMSSVDAIIKFDNRSTETVWVSENSEFAILLDCVTPMPQFHDKIPDMAYHFDFELDVFQKQAILCLERNQSVFVSAHTSAGKTVVAEYAVALTFRNLTRIIYTSPIKALSNQKYRDFKNTFADVGLITGDVQINPDAACLIMTTEILRSMLYNGSDIIRDLEFVVFDEVHYINNQERGVVWEEVLIMLPTHIKLILLSATVPNSREFASWIGRTKHKPVFVVKTEKRPVPLEHYVFTGNSTLTYNQCYKVMSSDHQFNHHMYAIASGIITERMEAKKGYKGQNTKAVKNQEDKTHWASLLMYLKKNSLLPTVAFIFSRKHIDELAELISVNTLLTSEESGIVHRMFQERVMRKLKPADRLLPQVVATQSMLKNGYGTHHSGMLPILKEIVEMMFCKGLVKLLLATETFAMGINMPARCVAFDSLRKFDGNGMRYLMPGEYTQMAGRAGRRGIDPVGVVIHLCKNIIPALMDITTILNGKAESLKSQFRLTYSMILNIVRAEQLHIQDMMKRSFSEFTHQKIIQKNEKRIVSIEQNLRKMDETIDDSKHDLELFYDLFTERGELYEQIMTHIESHYQSKRMTFLNRVVAVRTSVQLDANYSARRDSHASYDEITSSEARLRKTAAKLQRDDCVNDGYLTPGVCIDGTLTRGFTVLMPSGGQHNRGGFSFVPIPTDTPRLMHVAVKDMYLITHEVIEFSLSEVLESTEAYQNDTSITIGEDAQLAYQNLVRVAIRYGQSGLPPMDLVTHLNLKNLDTYELNDRKNNVCRIVDEAFSAEMDDDFKIKFREVCRRKDLEKLDRSLKYFSSDASLAHLPDFNNRIQVLQSLDYFVDLTTILLKGRVACEISSEEFILTEIIFDNILSDLDPIEMAAIVSGIVHHKRKSNQPEINLASLDLTPNLLKATQRCYDLNRRLSVLQKRHGIEVTAMDDYTEIFNFDIINIIYMWTEGELTFAEIMTKTDLQEGIIVRVIQRINELLADIRKAGIIYGDPSLSTRASEAMKMIKRDIVFAGSLYI